MKIKSVSFITLGCRLNQAEEERLRREFLEAGIFITDLENSDLLIVNSCSVTGVADRKTHQAIKKAEKANSRLKIVLIGCGAKEYPEVDLWITNQDKPRTLEIIKRHFDIDESKKRQIGPKSGRTRALLKIQDGCNNYCAYCIVPILRGVEVSTNSKDVIKEAKKLEKLGYKELVLSGVNVGKYNCELGGLDLTGLLRELLHQTKFPRIRLSSINPQDVDSEIVELWAKEPRLCRHFHLSLQSGSNSVLKRMGRPYTAQFYYSLVKNIYKKIPDIAITTDVIVGFPGETDKEFKETLKFVKRVKFAKLHIFRYSKRSGTRAETMENQVEESIKTARSKELIKIGKKLEKRFKKQFLREEVDVLFEEKKGEFWYGLTSNYIRIKYLSKENLENKFIKIKVNKENIT